MTPCIAVERELWPVFISSLVLGSSQFIAGLAMHWLAPTHCLAWMLTAMASGGVICTLRSVEADDTARVRMVVLHRFTVLIYLGYFASACFLFAILDALAVWFTFSAIFLALVVWITGPMYW